ncbi:cell division protein Fic [Kineosporia sp. NBRC 101677]|uniref:Fic family protein n=1 Tax=Kineosporia sp. NBRC 101677 TaxID=3032197 RepID=UPI0024A56FDD|nr:Fic family protein [Kineosporia sp. NBRC 101677]GLY15937.1 cell division protein Fic [Kineosporia sp. NBRC 101677]
MTGLAMLIACPEPERVELDVLNRIDELRERLRWQLHEPRRWSGSLRRLSLARAIQGSNSIEGYDARLDDAAAVALGEDPLDVGEETQRALAGHRDAMTHVLQLRQDEEFEHSTQLIKSLHFMMTSYSLANRPGLWRTGQVYVQKEDTGQIVYEGADPADVPALMRALVTRLNEERSADAGHALLYGAMAHLNLVMVHPFKDGNGRMARCLQSLVLARSGLLSPVFLSIEEYLGKNTQDYYEVLARVGQGRWSPEADARPWIRFALLAHLRQAATMLRRVDESAKLWIGMETLAAQHKLPDRCLTALFDAASGLRVRNATYRSSLRDSGEDEISFQTASRDLKSMVDAELLVATGERRNRVYTAGRDLQLLRQGIVAQRDPRDDSDPFA